jgi:hypothetical protein
MKTFNKYIFLGLTLIAAGSCSKKNLDKTVYGVTTSDNYYETEEQIRNALTECYYQVKGVPYNTLQTAHYFFGDISTDDALKGGASEADYADGQQIQNFTMTSTNAVAGFLWSSAYTLINRCNTVIENAPNATGDKDLLTRYTNEAKFLRAWAYFNLVTAYGGVPLIVKNLEPDDILLPKSSPEEVFAQIYTDLTDATALPKRSEYPESEMGRVTSGAAWALIGKSYMFQGDFPNAETAFSKVVTSGEYELNSEYYMNFENEFRNSKESVFEIQFQAIPGVYPAVGNQLLEFFSSRSTEGGWGFHIPSQDLWDAYDPDDPRLTYIFIRPGDKFAGDNHVQDNSISPNGYQDRKIFVKTDERNGYLNNVNKNWTVIRYADVLLMYAEALNENGNSGAALPYLNDVRERARNSNPLDPKREIQAYVPPTDPSVSLPDVTTTDKAELRKAIWKERRLELGMEGHRRFDLLRQKRFGEVMRAYATKYNVDKGKLFSDDRDYLLPIPSNEVTLSQGTIEQNPKY